MYICDLGHSVADAGSDPTPRSASLRFGVGSLNPGSNQARRRRRGARAPAVSASGRCGAGAPVAHASSQVLGSRRRGFPRVAVLRLAPLRCARSTRPPLGPLCDLGIRRRSVTSPPLDAVQPHLRAGERAAHASQRPCKRF
nr:MAG TPA: hypothetical protein [Caudoviricetes sp.]